MELHETTTNHKKTRRLIACFHTLFLRSGRVTPSKKTSLVCKKTTFCSRLGGTFGSTQLMASPEAVPAWHRSLMVFVCLTGALLSVFYRLFLFCPTSPLWKSQSLLLYTELFSTHRLCLSEPIYFSACRYHPYVDGLPIFYILPIRL